jgi:hypothetical protein
VESARTTPVFGVDLQLEEVVKPLLLLDKTLATLALPLLWTKLHVLSLTSLVVNVEAVPNVPQLLEIFDAKLVFLRTLALVLLLSVLRLLTMVLLDVDWVSATSTLELPAQL